MRKKSINNFQDFFSKVGDNLLHRIKAFFFFFPKDVRMLTWKVCKIIPVRDVNYAARKMGEMCNGGIRSLRLKQIPVNHKICKESVANPGFAKMNINVTAR